MPWLSLNLFGVAPTGFGLDEIVGKTQCVAVPLVRVRLSSRGIHIIHLGKTWEKLMVAARIIVTSENPSEEATAFFRSL